MAEVDPKERPAEPKERLAERAAWVLMGLGLLASLLLHLVSALLGGMLLFSLLRHLDLWLQRRRLVRGRHARLVALGILGAVGTLLGALVVVGLAWFWRARNAAVPDLLSRMAGTLDSARTQLGGRWIPERFTDPGGLGEAMAALMKEHAQAIRSVGSHAGRALAHLVAGLLVGLLAAFRHPDPEAGARPGPLAVSLARHAARLLGAFEAVLFAQVRISAVNTLLTALFLYGALPAFGVHLPLRATLVAVTFAAGLLPVVGNLLSNTAVVLIALGSGPAVAVASLVFLVVVHKLEYLLNARIVGGSIHAQAWEVLLSMVLMEAAFGLPGLVTAPILYAYAKGELRHAGML